jgi:hypothetical protein
MLLDKGYFDYDFEKIETVEEYHEKTEEELKDILAGFGFKQFAKKPETDEEIQEHILKQMEE